MGSDFALSSMISNPAANTASANQNKDMEEIIINPSDIVAVHAEKKWCRILTETADYSCRKRLYELEQDLGPEFMRISKSILVCIRKIDSVEAVFNGMLLLHMKNGSKEYVSRTYLPNLKSYLGI